MTVAERDKVCNLLYFAYETMLMIGIKRQSARMIYSRAVSDLFEGLKIDG